MIRQGKYHQNHFLSGIQILDSFSWVILLVLSPLFMMIKPQQSWLLLIIPLLWLISKIAKKNPIPATPFNFVFLIIAFQVLVSLYATYDIAVSLQKITGVVWGMAVFFALLKLAHHRKGIIVTTLVYLAGSTGIVLLGFLGIDWPTNKIIIFNQFLESFPTFLNSIPALSEGFHPNEVGGALTWMIPFWVVIVGWFVIRFQKLKKVLSPGLIIFLAVFNLFLLGLSLVVLIFSQSRSAYLGIFLGFLVMSIIALPRKAKLIYSVILMMGFIFLGYLVLNGQFMETINRFFPDSSTASMAFSTNTLSGRVEIWARGIYAVQDFAFTGMGMNTFRTIVNVLYPLQTISADIPIKDIGHAHNLFLQTALDLGIPGLVAFVGMYIISFWMMVSSLRSLKRRSDRDNTERKISKEFYFVIILGLFSAQIAHVVYGMTDAIAFGAKPGIIFWVMQSIVCAVYLKVRQHDYL